MIHTHRVNDCDSIVVVFYCKTNHCAFECQQNAWKVRYFDQICLWWWQWFFFFYWVLEHNWDIIVWFLQQFLLLASSLHFTLWPWLVSFPVKKGHSLANRPRYKPSKENKKNKNNTLNSLVIPDLLSYRGAIQGLWGPCSFIKRNEEFFFFVNFAITCHIRAGLI